MSQVPVAVVEDPVKPGRVKGAWVPVKLWVPVEHLDDFSSSEDSGEE